jgi:hypothetical protein
MPIVGFNYDKITAEKTNQITGKLNIKNNLSIKNIEQEKLPVGRSEEVLKLDFEYLADYEPDIGKIVLNGHILLMEDPKKIKEIQDSWNKDKTLLKEITPLIFNSILGRCNIKGLTLSQEINLPPQIRLPFMKQQETNN